MLRIIIFGGHGKIALLTEQLLAKRGHGVTAVIRNPAHSDEVVQAGAKPLVADLESLDADGIAKLISGHDAVVWSAGAGGGNPARTMAVDRDAAIASMEAAEQAGVSRYVMVSYFGASEEHGIDPENSFFTYAEAKAAADAHLRASSLKWTVLGPSGLTLDEPSGLIDAAADSSGTVSRGNVAEVVVEVLENDATINRTIRFNDGETPIANAVEQASKV